MLSSANRKYCKLTYIIICFMLNYNFREISTMPYICTFEDARMHFIFVEDAFVFFFVFFRLTNVNAFYLLCI